MSSHSHSPPTPLALHIPREPPAAAASAAAAAGATATAASPSSASALLTPRRVSEANIDSVALSMSPHSPAPASSLSSYIFSTPPIAHMPRTSSMNYMDHIDLDQYRGDHHGTFDDDDHHDPIAEAALELSTVTMSSVVAVRHTAQVVFSGPLTRPLHPVPSRPGTPSSSMMIHNHHHAAVAAAAAIELPPSRCGTPTPANRLRIGSPSPITSATVSPRETPRPTTDVLENNSNDSRGSGNSSPVDAVIMPQPRRGIIDVRPRAQLQRERSPVPPPRSESIGDEAAQGAIVAAQMFLRSHYQPPVTITPPRIESPAPPPPSLPTAARTPVPATTTDNNNFLRTSIDTTAPDIRPKSPSPPSLLARFATTMRDPKLYQSLRAFAASLHSEENLLFLESLAALESLLTASSFSSSSSSNTIDGSTSPNPPPPRVLSNGSTRALDRFLNRRAASGTPSSSTAVSPISPTPPQQHTSTFDPSRILVGEEIVLFRQLYDAFLDDDDDTPCEINLSEPLRRSVKATLGVTASPCTAGIFDECADEVLNMVYTDTFKKFVARERVLDAGAALIDSVSPPSQLSSSEQQQQQQQSYPKGTIMSGAWKKVAGAGAGGEKRGKNNWLFQRKR